MLLNEIAADYIHHKEGEDLVTEFIPKLEDSVDIRIKTIDDIQDYFTPEEKQEFEAAVERVGEPPNVMNLNIITVYTVNKDDSPEVQQLLDALKMRPPKKSEHKPSFISGENWTKMMMKAVELLRNPIFRKGQRGKTEIQQLADIFNQVDKNWLVVGLDSSSPVVKEIAKIIAKQLNIRMLGTVFKKGTPQLSKWIVSGKDKGKLRPNDLMLSNLNPLYRRKRLISKVFRAPSMSKDRTSTRKIAKSFQAKNFPSKVQPDGIRGLYGWQQLDANAKVLHNRPIIIVDDNIESSRTFIDAVKSLYKMGIFPSKIICFCPHKLLNPSATSQKQQLTQRSDKESSVTQQGSIWDHIPSKNIPSAVIDDIMDAILSLNRLIETASKEYADQYPLAEIYSAIMHKLPLSYKIPITQYKRLLSIVVRYIYDTQHLTPSEIYKLSPTEFDAIGGKARISKIIRTYDQSSSIRNPIPVEDRHRIIELYKSGVSPSQIYNKEFSNYSRQQIQYVISKYRLSGDQVFVTQNKNQINSKHSSEVKADIINLLQQGIQIKYIHQLYPNIPYSTISNIARNVQYSSQRAPSVHISNATLRQIYQLYNQGLTHKNIGDQLHLGKDTIGNIISQMHKKS